MCVFSNLSGVYSRSFGHRLDAYIYDYLLKRKLYASARSFLAEGKILRDPVGKTVIDHCNSNPAYLLTSIYP